MRLIRVKIFIVQVIIIGLPLFSFLETGRLYALPASSIESELAGASIGRFTNLLAAATMAEESYKPRMALAYYEEAKRFMPSESAWVEIEMNEYYRKYAPGEYYRKHRLSDVAPSAFMNARLFYQDNRDYESSLSLLEDPPTNRSNMRPLPLSLLHETTIKCMQLRPGVMNVMVPSEAGTLRTNTVRCFARLPMQTNLLASSDEQFQVEWEELLTSRSNRLVLVETDSKRRFSIMECPMDVHVLWSPAGRYLAIQKNLAPVGESVVRVLDTKKPSALVCVEDLLPEVIRLADKENLINHGFVKWLADDCLILYCFTNPTNGVPKHWPLRLLKMNGEWQIMDADH